jgi:hypothetical protein
MDVTTLHHLEIKIKDVNGGKISYRASRVISYPTPGISVRNFSAESWITILRCGLPKLLRFYIFWSEQAQLIAASLPHVLLALPTHQNYPLLQVPIFKINCNLYTFYHVLGVLRQEFSPTLRDKLPTDFAVLDTLRVQLDLTANLLLGQYFPRALARTLQEQWGVETLRTEIPPRKVCLSWQSSVLLFPTSRNPLHSA